MDPDQPVDNRAQDGQKTRREALRGIAGGAAGLLLGGSAFSGAARADNALLGDSFEVPQQFSPEALRRTYRFMHSIMEEATENLVKGYPRPNMHTRQYRGALQAQLERVLKASSVSKPGTAVSDRTLQLLLSSDVPSRAFLPEHVQIFGASNGGWMPCGNPPSGRLEDMREGARQGVARLGRYLEVIPKSLEGDRDQLTTPELLKAAVLDKIVEQLGSDPNTRDRIVNEFKAENNTWNRQNVVHRVAEEANEKLGLNLDLGPAHPSGDTGFIFRLPSIDAETRAKDRAFCRKLEAVAICANQEMCSNPAAFLHSYDRDPAKLQAALVDVSMETGLIGHIMRSQLGAESATDYRANMPLAVRCSASQWGRVLDREVDFKKDPRVAAVSEFLHPDAINNLATLNEVQGLIAFNRAVDTQLREQNLGVSDQDSLRLFRRVMAYASIGDSTQERMAGSVRLTNAEQLAEGVDYRVKGSARRLLSESYASTPSPLETALLKRSSSGDLASTRASSPMSSPMSR